MRLRRERRADDGAAVLATVATVAHAGSRVNPASQEAIVVRAPSASRVSVVKKRQPHPLWSPKVPSLKQKCRPAKRASVVRVVAATPAIAASVRRVNAISKC